MEESGSLQGALHEKTRLKRPSKYKVVLHNDHYTTMDFVVMILMTIFGKTENDAISLMYQVHKSGAAIAGVYTREVAETKIDQVTTKAKEKGFPLLCTMEKD